jgi:post-segregation antitoxin (ccd killing protein)
VCHTVRTNIWIPDEIKVKIDAYNEKNKYAKINVSKIAQDAIVKALSEAENTARA